MDAKVEIGASPPSSPPPQQLSSSPDSLCSTKSRRSVKKRVVSVPASEADGTRSKGGSEVAPLSDSWTWRKYGQKPIKGSPYPRGYYRCSSSKGCPARKQVERSRVDPTTFIVTYSSDHDHRWHTPKKHHLHQESLTASIAAAESNNSKPKEAENLVPAHTSSAADKEKKLSDLIVEEPAGLMMSDDFGWFINFGTLSSTKPTTAFCGPILGAAEANVVLFDDCDKFSGIGNGGTLDVEDDALFAGLGELPECSAVFRRGFLERRWRGGDDGKWCGIEAEETAAAAAPWCGSTR